MKPLLFAFIVFVSAGILTQYLAYQRYLITLDTEHEKVVNEINTVNEKLKASLSYSLSATKTLAFLSAIQKSLSKKKAEKEKITDHRA